MTRFIARLFGTRPVAATAPARRPALGLESLETRETPSGHLGHALKAVTHLLHHHGVSAHVAHHTVDLPIVSSLLHR